MKELHQELLVQLALTGTQRVLNLHMTVLLFQQGIMLAQLEFLIILLFCEAQAITVLLGLFLQQLTAVLRAHSDLQPVENLQATAQLALQAITVQI